MDVAVPRACTTGRLPSADKGTACKLLSPSPDAALAAALPPCRQTSTCLVAGPGTRAGLSTRDASAAARGPAASAAVAPTIEALCHPQATADRGSAAAAAVAAATGQASPEALVVTPMACAEAAAAPPPQWLNCGEEQHPADSAARGLGMLMGTDSGLPWVCRPAAPAAPEPLSCAAARRMGREEARPAKPPTAATTQPAAGGGCCSRCCCCCCCGGGGGRDRARAPPASWCGEVFGTHHPTHAHYNKRAAGPHSQRPQHHRARRSSGATGGLSGAWVMLVLLLGSAVMSWTPACGQASSSSASTTLSSSSGSSSGTRSGSSEPTVKWTFLVYMLADNNLECFGILDLIEMMEGMAQEPPGCQSSACGGGCSTGYVATSTASCGEGKLVSRCCPASAYPDVLVLADRGVSSCSFTAKNPSLDYSMLATTWTSARELLVLPGGKLDQVRDLGEIDMAAPDQLSTFLQRAFVRFGSSGTSTSSGVTRKYALVLWDHGNGWKGYGVDDTCSPGGAVSSTGCDQFTISTLTKGLAAGLAGQAVSKLDVLGFDACLMSMYEVAGALAPYARTLFASEMLEPGHGWDYAALGAMTAAAYSGSTAGTAAEVAMAQIWISKYKAQALSYQTTGVTLALADLSVTSSQLVPAVAALAGALQSALTANSSYASGVLRRRMAMAAVGSGEQESSVDLGSMLSELRQANDLDSGSRSAAATAATAYNATVLAFGRDDSMPAGTGVAIYFPAQAAKMDSDYIKLTATSAGGVLAPVAAAWAAFLAKLYDASVAVASSETSFSFLYGSAASVPYLDVGSGSYVLQGVLNSALALSAQSYYGFVDASQQYYILAGTQPAIVDGVSVVGTWRRLLWGLSQTINTTSSTSTTSSSASSATTTSSLLAPTADPARSAAALMFASETWTLSADGTAATAVSLTASVRYGDTCSASRAAMTAGVLQYTYRLDTGRASLQLFAQQPSGAYGEVSAQAGGVIVPLMYKLPTDFSGAQTITYEYSGCLKWGYNGTVRVVVVDMDSAADTLAVDVRQDMLMFLLARDLSLSKVAYLFGSFAVAALADTTVGGCQCLTAWKFTGQKAGTATTYSGCANPDGDPSGPWCPILAGSCADPDKAMGSINAASQPWDYCSPRRTLSGCSCSAKYPTDASNATFMFGRCFRDDERALSRGAWCTVNNATCPSQYRAHGSNDTSYDYCETKTVEGCYCINSWTYNNVTYNGTCATGFYPEFPPEGLTNSTRWCRVQPACNTRNQLRGYRIGLCGPAVPPRATIRLNATSNATSTATCALPASVSGGVRVHDCVPWRNGPLPTNRVDGIAPMCPLDPVAISFAICVPRNCTSLDLSACPATSPEATPQLPSSAWLAPTCLQQLCSAVLLAGDSTTCREDGARAATAFSQLNASASATAVLRSDYLTDSLASLCTSLRGTDCLTTIMLPACPALRLNGSAMYESTYVDDSNTTNLCRTDCLKALCSVASSKCARSRLVERLRLTLLEAMDARCSSSTLAGGPTAAVFSKPAAFMCAELTAPASTCEPTTTLTGASGDIVLRPVSGTSQYAPLTNCTWRIQPAGLSYIQLTFRAFSTEPLYDSLLVEDGDGPVAVVSGGSEGLPGPLVTDTGQLVLTFTSDSSIQMSGFTASYTATVTRTLPIPTCGARHKLMMITMRTADYGNEDSWVIGGYKVATTSSSSASSSGSSTTSSNSSSSTTSGSSTGAVQQVMLAAGGALPSAALALFPSTNVSLVRVDDQYRNSRSYTTYACVPTGLSMVYMFDGYGDGWTGGSLAVSYMPTTSTSYVLINATVIGLNTTAPLQVLANMPTTAADYSAALARNKGSSAGRFAVRFTLRLAGEVSGTAGVSEPKQLILRGAVSSLVSVDITTVAVESITGAGSSSSSSSTTGRRRSLLSNGPDQGGGDGYLEEYDNLEEYEEVETEEEGKAVGSEADSEAGEEGAAEGASSLEAGTVAASGPGHVAAETDIAQATNAAAVRIEAAAGAAAEVARAVDPADVLDEAVGKAAEVPMHSEQGKEEMEVEKGKGDETRQDLNQGQKDDQGQGQGPMEVHSPKSQPSVHGEGVVEALLASARALGLRLPEAGQSGALEGSAGPAAPDGLGGSWRRRRRGRALQGLEQLLSEGGPAGYDLSDFVSVQQPYVLWSKDVAAGEHSHSAVAAEKPQGAAAPKDDGAATGDDTGGSSNSSSSNSSSSSGDAEPVLPPGYTLLFNGLLVGPDGVPLVAKGGSSSDPAAVAAAAAAAAAAASATATTPSSSTDAVLPRNLVSLGYREAEKEDEEEEEGAVAASHGRGSDALNGRRRRGVLRQDSALHSMTEAVTGLHNSLDAAARRARGSANGGRTPVPALQQLLPQLLRQGAKHLAAVAAATAPSVADAADAGAASAAAGGDEARMAVDVGDELMSVARSHGGGEVGCWRMAAAAIVTPIAATNSAAAPAAATAAADASVACGVRNGPAGALAGATATRPAEGAAAKLVDSDFDLAAACPPKTNAAAAAGAAQAAAPGRSLPLPGVSAGDEVAANGVPPGGVPCRQQAEVAEGVSEVKEEEAEGFISRRGRRGAQGVRRKGRRLQQQTSSSPTGVDVVVQVQGYSTQADATAAASQLQSAVSSDLRNMLGDNGWSYAAPSLVGNMQILDGGVVISTASAPSSSSSGTNWGKLGIIIGAAAGGTLLLLVVILGVVWMVRRSRDANGAQVAPAPIKVQPAGAAAGGDKAPPWTAAAGGGGRRAAAVPPVSADGAASRYSKSMVLEDVDAAELKAQLQAKLQMQQAAMRQQQQQQIMMMQQQQQLQHPQAMQAGARSGASLMALSAAGHGASMAVTAPMAAAAAAGRPQQPNQLMAGGEPGRGALEARGPAVGRWMASGPSATAAPSMLTPVAPMYGGGIPGMSYPSQGAMDPYMAAATAAAMDPYGMGAMSPYGPYGDPYAMSAMGYDPYGAYGDPYVGAYPAPPAAWGAGGMPRTGWQ